MGTARRQTELYLSLHLLLRVPMKKVARGNGLSLLPPPSSLFISPDSVRIPTRNPRRSLMAEICCDTKASAATVSPRSSRRRRMEIRRFRFGADASELTEQEIKQKRQKIELAAPPPAVHESASTKEIGSDALTVTAADPAGKISACPAFGTTSVCGRRRDMEDAVSVHPSFFRRGTETEEEFHFFGVFDGHGCSHVATACKDRMHEMLAGELEALPPPTAALEWKDAMEKAFGRMDDAAVVSRHPPKTADCRCELQLPKCDHVGSTAVVAVVGGDRIVVGNCGDSRAVLCRKGVAVPLSVDHKPDRPDELERIEAAGGRVIFWEGARVLGVLAMSRAIGDGYLKPFVTAEPEVTVTERTEDDECLIMASDGLWDVVSNEMACDIVRMCLRGSRPVAGGGDVAAPDKRCADAAMLLTKLALARKSADNVSVVVVDLRTRGTR